MSCGQTSIPGVYLRGGSSKALFLKETDIPFPGPFRDAVLKRLMGTPDPIQIDGMGGTRVVTSKIAIIKTSDREDADVEYTFSQVGIGENTIRYSSNCGNISSGVGPFAIDEGLIKKPFRKGITTDPGLLAREVRIWQTGTKKLLIAHVPIDEITGKSVSKGNFAIAAVPGTGAPILMDFRTTVGAFLGRGPIPSGLVTNILEVGGRTVEVSICDVATLCVFVRASDMGITGTESASTITSNSALILECKELRGKAAHLLGMCRDWKRVDEEAIGIPLIVMIAPVSDANVDAHLHSRLLLNNTCHDSMAGTGAMCTAGCSRITGSLVQRMIGEKALQEDELKISHPLGMMPARVEAAVSGKRSSAICLENPEFNVLAFARTSRRLMEGTLFVPEEVWDGVRDAVPLQNC